MRVQPNVSLAPEIVESSVAIHNLSKVSVVPSESLKRVETDFLRNKIFLSGAAEDKNSEEACRCRYTLIPDVSKRITHYPRIRGEDKMVRLLGPKNLRRLKVNPVPFSVVERLKVD